MDKVTDSVRAFYEAYPYPPGDRVDSDGYQARWLLSAIERPADGGTLQVLEAGCGRGLNLQAAAAAQPEAVFTGIDINRVAIEEASRAAASAGLANLRFEIADLMQPRSLPQAPGGFDLILSYGVIHHLSDPLAGLRHLRDRLSPHGVLALMVDGRFGRQPLDRFLQCLAALPHSSDARIGRTAVARSLARVAEQGLFRGTHWQGTAEADPVEFADRCLHVHERSYTIDELWALLAAAGLRFLRWFEPADWHPAGMFEAPELRPLLDALEPERQYGLVERLFERPKLTLLTARAEALSRRPLAVGEIAVARFRLNPQLKRRAEGEGEPGWQLRQQPPLAAGTACAEAMLLAADVMADDFSGEQMLAYLNQRGFQRREVLETLVRLEAVEWLYRPHPVAGGAPR